MELNASNAVADFNEASANRLYSSLSSSLRYSGRYITTKQISHPVNSNGKRSFLADTLALVRRLEAQGVPSKQAEAIAAAITEVLNDGLENVAQSFTAKAEMQKEHHFALLRRETKKLQGDIDKLYGKLRSIQDELVNQDTKLTNLTNKLDKEIHVLRAQLEAAKYDSSILESSKATNLYQRQFMEHEYLYLWMLMNALEIEEYNWKLGGKAAKLLFCLTLRQFWLLSLDQLIRHALLGPG